MKRLCICPFTSDYQVLMTVKPAAYKVVSAATPSGMCPDGADVSFIGNRALSGIIAHNNLKQAISESDYVLIPEAVESGPLSNYALQCRRMAMHLGKIIIDESFLSRIINAVDDELFAQYADRDILTPDSLGNLDVPVVFIGALLDTADSFELLQHLVTRLVEMGHNPLGLTENKLGVLYSNNYVTDLGLSPDFGGSITRLNERVRWILRIRRPDIMLVELPKPIADYSRYIHYDYGVSAFALSKALMPDGLIVCTSLNLTDPDFLAAVCDSALLRFGASWWTVHVGNQVVKVDNEPEDRSFSRYHREEKDAIQIASALSSADVPAFCMYDTQSIDSVIINQIESDFFVFANEAIV